MPYDTMMPILHYNDVILFKVIAGYDDGNDPRQPRDIKVHQYSKLVSKLVVTTTVPNT